MKWRRILANEKAGYHPVGKNRYDAAMSCFVYLLGSNGKGGHRTYVGWTTDLEKRLAAHNLGKGARSTRGREWKLLHSEQFETKQEAMSREWHLKRDRAFRKRLAAQIDGARGAG